MFAPQNRLPIIVCIKRTHIEYILFALSNFQYNFTNKEELDGIRCYQNPYNVINMKPDNPNTDQEDMACEKQTCQYFKMNQIFTIF